MCSKHIFVQYLNNLNEVVKQPLQLTQRIKFTCFDISSKFIIFGATSGGIYIYSREPCQFLKLVPTKEGSITILKISPDENIIAVASCKGILLVVENFIIENNTFYKTFLEHERNTITAFKWHGNQLYSGDNIGKISVTVINNTFAKVLFQSPCSSLMDLDSSVVQIDSFSKYLLIATQTRTYLCDTEKEQYRQIGKKLRDGDYGACFLNKDVLEESSKLPGKLEKEMISENVKIYCARPGGRLWEATFDAVVTYTHHFKKNNSLIENVPPMTIIYLDEKIESHLKLAEFVNLEIETRENFNFNRIFVFHYKYIFTYNEDGFYIFDLDSVELIFWNNSYRGIKDIKLYKNFIYIWTPEELVVLSLTTIEDLAIKTLIDKQYYVCAELCVRYLDHLMTLVESSDKIYLLIALKEKLKHLEATDLLDKVAPLLDRIKEKNNTVYAHRFKSGMVVLNSHLVSNNFIKSMDEKLSRDAGVGDLFEKISENANDFIKAKVEPLNELKENKNSSSESCDLASRDSEKEDLMGLFLEQYNLSLVNGNIELPKFKEILQYSTCDRIIELIDRFIHLESHEKPEEVHFWCNNQYLKWFSKNIEIVCDLDTNSKAFQYLLDSFTAINMNNIRSLNCICNFPLPVASTVQVKYYPLGCEILKKLPNKEIICLKVPPLWRDVLKEHSQKDIRQRLPYFLQFGDEELLSTIANKMPYDRWDEATKMLVKLKNNKCLNCDREFHEDMQRFVMDWSSFGKMMVKSLGGSVAIKLLKRYSQFIPSDSLDSKFYQLCIFSTIFDYMHDGLRCQAVDLASSSQKDDATNKEFEDVLKNFLNKKHMQMNAAYIPKNGMINIDARCPLCSLPFNSTILEETVRLQCGHVYHAFCKQQKPNFCHVCT